MTFLADKTIFLQPSKPKQYKLPPVVQPNWKWPDLVLNQTSRSYAQTLAKQLCKCYGVRHCLLLDRARSGLFLLRRAFGLSGEWIITSTMHRPTGVLLRQICDSISFADIDKYFTMSDESANQLITKNTSTILVTHLFGRCADILKLRKTADQHGLFLIENAVHMPGNINVCRQRIGSIGDATVLSFNVDKPLGAILGGALLTNRNDVWNAVAKYQLAPPEGNETYHRILKTYLAYRLKPLILKIPGTKKYQQAHNGVAEIERFSKDNYKQYTPKSIHPMQAKVALQCSLKEKSYVDIRKHNAKQLFHILKDEPDLELPQSSSNQPNTFTYFPLIIKNDSRYKIGECLAAAGIESKWRYYPLHLQTGFTETKKNDLSMSERLWLEHLLVPAGVRTTTDQIIYLGESIKKALKQ